MPNGLASTWPWPMPFSARCTGSSAAGTEPVTVVNAGHHVVGAKAQPQRRGRQRVGPSWEPSWPKVVLQDRAKAVRNGTVPRSNPPLFGSGRPPITTVPGQATGDCGSSPASAMAASAVTILNVEPGG